MAVGAINTFYVIVAAATSGGTAPGTSSAPTGCSLTTPSDISGNTTQAQVGSQVASIEVTTFGSGGFTAVVAGLKTGKASLTLLNDYAASAINSLIGINGTVCAVGGKAFLEVRPSSGSRSSSNPGFVCKFLNTGWDFINAQVGGLSTVQWDVAVDLGYAELTA